MTADATNTQAGIRPGAAASPIVEMHELRKEFPGVVAVADASVDIYSGTVHVFAGENGAGKSTLMKMLAQVERPTSGSILLGGEPLPYHGPRYALSRGIAMVHQEIALAPHLTVAANLWLGREAGRYGWLDRTSERKRAANLLRRVGLDLSPSVRAGQLPVALQQLVEIAKAIDVDARVLIMDEPTATLTEREVEDLMGIIAELKAQGMAILWISHRLDEIGDLADTVTVMRDGKVVATRAAAELEHDELVRLMVGREVKNLYPKPHVEIKDAVLRVEGLTKRGVLEDVDMSVHAGEIVGLAGLIGAGRTELAKAVFGAEPPDRGTVSVDGEVVNPRSPSAGIAVGIGYLTEDRKGEGLALQLGIDKNITLANLPMKFGFLNRREEHGRAEARRQQLRIRTPSVRRLVRTLSGGNQQKVVVAKWLETDARVLFFDEPARGVDVGAKAEMFEVIGDLAAQGKAIVLISSYLPELLNMCDRIIVLREGRVAGEVKAEEFSEERIVALATSQGGPSHAEEQPARPTASSDASPETTLSEPHTSGASEE